MAATINSSPAPAAWVPRGLRSGTPHRKGLRVNALLLVAWLTALPVHAEGALAAGPAAVEAPADPVALAHQTYAVAKARWEERPDDAQAAWQLGRACFDCADVASSDQQRAAFAREGIAACRKAIKLDPKLGPAYYYLAMNLGQWAQTKGLGALKLVDEMVPAFQKAIELDPTFDFAGPHRSLGLLYRDAPGWPISVGSRAKARRHLEKAVALSPDYPDNRLSLIEAYLAWGDTKAARAQIEPTRKGLEAARRRFTGLRWQRSWADWNQRWQRVLRKLKQSE